MDGSFACPECGSEIEVEGLAPGRQVRCGFCDRLLEVPYLPRVPAAGLRRRRFGRSPWMRWAWAGLAAVAVVAIGLSGYRAVRRYFRSAHEGSIHKLLASSRVNEQAGRLDLALVDLDAALDLARQSAPPETAMVAEQQARRAALAVKEAESVLDRLIGHGPKAFPLGDWLNLIARTDRDPDLTSLAARIKTEFGRNVLRQANYELDAARRDYAAGRAVESLRRCDRVAHLMPHLPAAGEAAVRREAGELAARLIASYGVAMEVSRGDFILGTSESYRAHLTPVLVKGLEAKGFLPYRDTSPWKSAWDKAMYRLRLEISERLEGNYMMSQNRLTKIEARLKLSTVNRLVWQTVPSARTIVPLPNLPVYLSGKLASSTERTDECERLLYDNARAQIDEKFGYALSNMPGCCP